MYKNRRYIPPVTGIVIIVTVLGIFASGLFFSSLSKGEHVIKTKAEIVRVIDGDTYVLKINGEDTTVRLIGVDTPENVAPSDYSKENTSEGKTVSEIVRQKLRTGDTLYVEYDVSPTDKYGRTLAYLYFEDGTMVQEWLLENGYARIMTVPPNIKYADDFAKFHRSVAKRKVGLWNGFFENDASPKKQVASVTHFPVNSNCVTSDTFVELAKTNMFHLVISTKYQKL